ncbi:MULTISPECIES: endo-beta-N-acetylglucosaminidase [Helcococcus]|uniref:Mannosyl-glycoprotein endo-beta-N-acetylglucosaminidase n=1 Tax=Helcococcus bovis TaxID=3153252 RepID=A0ABW9F7B1_9FIRM
MKKIYKKILATALSVVFLASFVPQKAYAADSIPMTGEAKRKANQPKFSGYRVWDIRDWTPENDPGAQLLKAKVPLQKRNEPFKATQANPTLESNAEIMLMQGDYGNTFTDGMMYNNTFGYYPLSFWQYTDYFAPWHGATTATTPEDLYDRKYESKVDRGWEKRYFEFGVLNIPNPAYTNAAHKNGVKSIAVIYFDQYYRQGQTINELFVQDKDGKFPVAEKLIEMAKFFGYDGYFFNAEESVEERFENSKKLFLKRLHDAGLYTQYYNTENAMNSSKYQWLFYDTDGDGKEERIQDSVFVNYGWPGTVDKQMEFIKSKKIDPFKNVFYGVEANQNGFNGNHTSGKQIQKLYEKNTKNPRASIALFTPSDFYQRALPEDMIQDTGYQWMIEERARMYFSGAKVNPRETGMFEGYKREDVMFDDASGWVGVADFTSEKSVIKGSNFYSSFNIGKGVQYFENGKVSLDEEWSNINIQDIPLTWQWWIDSENTKGKLNLDFDFGKKEVRRDKSKQVIELPFNQIGAYEGGSSLVTYGKLDGQNTIRLYKTDLDINQNSKLDITFRKTSTDDVKMKLSLIFKDKTGEIVKEDIENSEKSGAWTTSTINLSKYDGKKLAMIGLSFEGKSENYQMNIGKISVSDGLKAPSKPEGFKIQKLFSDDEMIVEWKKEDFSNVDKYEIRGVLPNGEKVFLGGIYDDVFYVKSLKNANKFELVAVGKNGEKSEPSIVEFNPDSIVNRLNYETETVEVTTKKDHPVKGSIVQSKHDGKLVLNWENPKADYKELELRVTLPENDSKALFTKIIKKGESTTDIEIPYNNGEKFEATIYTVLNDGSKLESVTLTGKLKDTYVQRYNKELFNEKNKTFWSPEPNDWSKLHVKLNDEIVKFSNRFGWKSDYAIRGATLMNVTFSDDKNTSEDELEDELEDEMQDESEEDIYDDFVDSNETYGLVEVVLEDYVGNKSLPTYIILGKNKAEDLISKIEKSEDMINSYKYKEDGKDKVKEAVEKAKALLKKKDVSNGEIKDMEKMLDEIQNTLVLKEAEKETPKETQKETSKEKYEDKNKFVPKVVYGSGQIIQKGKVDKIEFKSDGLLKTLEKVEVDGKELSKSDYFSLEGSTIVILPERYFGKLQEGNHILTMKFGEGEKNKAGNVDFGFTIKDNKLNPLTADYGVGIYISLLGISILGIYLSKKKIIK